MSGRIRTIKPELLEDEKVAALSDDEFRLFIGLLLVADDYGNFRANPTWLRGQVFWAREPSRDTRETLASLSDVGLVVLYEVSAQHYGHICGWSKHQKIDRPSKPKIPGPTAENVEKKPNVGQPREPSRVCVEPSTIPIGGSGSGSGSGPGSGGECEGNHPNEDAEPKTEPTAKLSPLPPANAAGPATVTETKPEAESKTTRKRQLPKDWRPNAKHAEKAKKLGLNLEAEAEAFIDHHSAHGSTMLKWDLAFNTWLRNATKFGPAPSNSTPEYIEIPDDAGTTMSLSEALNHCPKEYRQPIQEFLGGV